MGNFKVLHSVIPFIRESKGRIVISSSMAGKMAPPYLTSYAVSKFGLEGLADSLRRELIPFGVKVVVMEWGNFKTSIFGSSLQLAPNPIYPNERKIALSFDGESIKNAWDPDLAAQKVEEVLRIAKPKPRYAYGGRAAIASLVIHFPDTWIDKMLHMTVANVPDNYTYSLTSDK